MPACGRDVTAKMFLLLAENMRWRKSSTIVRCVCNFVGEVEDVVRQNNVRVFARLLGQYARIDVKHDHLGRL